MKKKLFCSLTFITSIWFISCTDDVKTQPLETIQPNEEIVNDLENPESVVETDLGKAEYFNKALVDNNYILINDKFGERNVYLMNKDLEVLFEWPLNGKKLGNDAFILPNGKLLAMFQSENPSIKLGGFGGILQILDKDGNVEWDYEYSTDDYIAHHDSELLPNGNILFQSWERKTIEESKEAGSKMDIELIPDALIEVNPSNNEIVWEWHAWDHLVQDHDASKSNFGVVSENPQLIDLNYVADEDGDIMHANGINYDEKNDLIYLSVNFFSEVWVIDHSTTTEEAASNSGGNLNKGGDLIYRFGNPEAYQNTSGERLFDHNHYPNLLEGSDEGKILIFSNGFTEEQSTAYELRLPNPLSLQANTDNEPKIEWSFTNEALFSPKVSGVVKLSNGNRLITEGNAGVWEVTEKGEVVWRFLGEGFFWRAYHYDKTSPEILSLGL